MNSGGSKRAAWRCSPPLTTSAPFGFPMRSSRSWRRRIASTSRRSSALLPSRTLASCWRWLYRDEIAQWEILFASREDLDRATTNISRAARAATYGAVETMLVDIDGLSPAPSTRLTAPSPSPPFQTSRTTVWSARLPVASCAPAAGCSAYAKPISRAASRWPQSCTMRCDSCSVGWAITEALNDRFGESGARLSRQYVGT